MNPFFYYMSSKISLIISVGLMVFTAFYDAHNIPHWFLISCSIYYFGLSIYCRSNIVYEQEETRDSDLLEEEQDDEPPFPIPPNHRILTLWSNSQNDINIILPPEYWSIIPSADDTSCELIAVVGYSYIETNAKGAGEYPLCARMSDLCYRACVAGSLNVKVQYDSNPIKLSFGTQSGDTIWPDTEITGFFLH